MFLPIQKRPALPEAQPQRRWAEDARSTWHLATVLPTSDADPFPRQRAVPSMVVILPRRTRRVRRVAPRAATVTFIYYSGDSAIFARVRSEVWPGCLAGSFRSSACHFPISPLYCPFQTFRACWVASDDSCGK